MIQINRLSKSFDKQKVLDNLDLSVKPGEKLMILGQNGAGKTTLMRCLLGEYKPDSGDIAINGCSPFTDRVNAIADIAFVPQIPPPLRLTVHELMYYASNLSGFDAAKVFELCHSLRLDLKPHLNKTFFKLSGGMKQKVLISIALARNTDMMIFDEPTANLDRDGRLYFMELLKENAQSRTMIFISHRIEDIEGLVTRKVTMDMGRITEDEEI